MADRLIDPGAGSYESLRGAFTWNIPATFNLGAACLDHPPESVAMIVDRDGATERYTFADIDRMSAALAAELLRRGVGRGDRVGVVIPQSLETAVAHVACWRIGVVSIPLAGLFGPDALAYRLTDADASLVIATPECRRKVAEAMPDLDVIDTVDDVPGIYARGGTVEPADTAAEDPAFLIYTSGTTGAAKGALHAHRTIFGHLTGFEVVYEYAPQPGDVIWTPADWAWIGALMDVLVPAWYHGMAVLTTPARFDPQAAVELMDRHAVTLAFLPPTALKMMRSADVDGNHLRLRAVMSGGEALGEAMHAWADERLGGAAINEAYGQTEANFIVGNCASTWPVKPGSMGRPFPGHTLEVHDGDGNRVVDEVGELAVRAPDPVLMLGYWNRPDATVEKYRGDWLLTGDLVREDDDGYLWFESRADDLIISAGYRIGPGEIEASLMTHDAVAMCAVIGVPHDTRGEVPAAWVVVRDDVVPGDGLADELQQHVRTRLAAHEVPRRITFVDELPTTTTGKILRRALRDGGAESP